MPHEDFAGGGESDAPAGALQQRHARFSFQRGQLLGDRGGRVGVGRGDGRDRTEVCQIAQQAQATNVEHQLSLRVC